MDNKKRKKDDRDEWEGENVYNNLTVLYTVFADLKLNNRRTVCDCLDRQYTCNMGIQTVKHVMMECPMLVEIREMYGITDVQKGYQVMTSCWK